MSFDLNNDPNRPIDRESDMRAAPVTDGRLETGRSRSWAGWVAAIAVVAVAAFAIYQWTGAPNTDPQPTASTTNSEPAPAKPMAPADTNAAPAPAAPSAPATGGAQQ